MTNASPPFDRAREPRKIELLSTLGPASFDAHVIERLTDAGVTLFRINLSHTRADALPDLIRFVRRHTRVPVCLDSEGAQIRTADVCEGQVVLATGACVALRAEAGEGDAHAIGLHPEGVALSLRPGDLVSLDFNGALLQVVDLAGDHARARVLRGGAVGSNKAVSLQRSLPLPAITPKDRRAIEIGRALGIRHFALSFAARARDVERMRELVGPGAFLISKIESRRALRNLDAIAKASDALLIDRGDLSREVEIDQIPRIQRAVIARGRALGVRTYVATNLLESMLHTPTPTRAEVNDVYTTLRDGADGLVLAAETAIGRHPIQCANLVAKIAAGDPTAPPGLDPCDPERTSLLIAPHGGALVPPRKAPVTRGAEVDVELPASQFEVAHQIASGFLSPLRGFMDRRTLDAVVAQRRLPAGPAWRVPILLSAQRIPAADRHLAPGVRLALRERGGERRLVFDVEEIFESRDEHGMRGNVVAGAVGLRADECAPASCLELTPDQTRHAFRAAGWTRVAGLALRHARSEDVARRVDTLLAESGADGIFLALCDPAVFDRERALAIQENLLAGLRGYADAVILGALAPLALRSAHERAWIDAVRFKNLGCSHVAIDTHTLRLSRRSLAELGLRAVAPRAARRSPPKGHAPQVGQQGISG